MVRQTDRLLYYQTCRWTDRRTDFWTFRLTDRQTDFWTYRWTNRQTDKGTTEHSYRWTDLQMDKQRDEQIIKLKLLRIIRALLQVHLRIEKEIGFQFPRKAFFPLPPPLLTRPLPREELHQTGPEASRRNTWNSCLLQPREETLPVLPAGTCCPPALSGGAAS